MTTDIKVGSLEEEALKRKERLRNLKRKSDKDADGNDISIAESLPKPMFRSYKPQDDTLKTNVLPDTKPSDLESEVKEQLAAGNSKIVIEDLDITNLAPRKPDWDLKRDIAKKLEKLERRTQKAIAELIRERLKSGQQGPDLLSLVNAGTELNTNKQLSIEDGTADDEE